MLNELYKKSGVITRMISAENPTGEKGKACLEKPDPTNPDLYWSKNSLGEDCKVNPFVRVLPHEVKVIADYVGSGVIHQFFIACDRANFSELQLRIYWDGEETPSVDCPVGAFFCLGHDGVNRNVFSLPIVVAPYRGCNCYWAMPFRKGFRIEVENNGDTITDILAYKVMFEEKVVDAEAAYFHARYNHSVTGETKYHTILDNVHGSGVYVGTYLAWSTNSPRWWGEGEVKFYIDGDREYPTICGTGTEDYFGGAWNFEYPQGEYGLFSTAYQGLTQVEKPDGLYQANTRFSMYRWHLTDPVRFEKDLKVTVQALGWRSKGRYLPLQDEITSVAFWYQKEPHAKFNDEFDVNELEII